MLKNKVLLLAVLACLTANNCWAPDATVIRLDDLLIQSTDAPDRSPVDVVRANFNLLDPRVKEVVLIAILDSRQNAVYTSNEIRVSKGSDRPDILVGVLDPEDAQKYLDGNGNVLPHFSNDVAALKIAVITSQAESFLAERMRNQENKSSQETVEEIGVKFNNLPSDVQLQVLRLAADPKKKIRYRLPGEPLKETTIDSPNILVGLLPPNSKNTSVDKNGKVNRAWFYLFTGKSNIRQGLIDRARLVAELIREQEKELNIQRRINEAVTTAVANVSLQAPTNAGSASGLSDEERNVKAIQAANVYRNSTELPRQAGRSLKPQETPPVGSEIVEGLPASRGWVVAADQSAPAPERAPTPPPSPRSASPGAPTTPPSHAGNSVYPFSVPFPDSRSVSRTSARRPFTAPPSRPR